MRQMKLPLQHLGAYRQSVCNVCMSMFSVVLGLRLSADAGRQTKKENIQFRPLCDGVFRAVPPTVNAKEFCGKILQQVPYLLPNLCCSVFLNQTGYCHAANCAKVIIPAHSAHQHSSIKPAVIFV